MQHRFHNYRRKLNSFQENQRFLGVIIPGVYSGWDRIELQALNVLRFHHDLTGNRPTDTNNLTALPNRGCLVSRQGFLIYEDGPIDLPVETNVGNPNVRIDLVLMHHQYLNSPGGQQASYSIVKGSMSETLEPAVPIPTSQIIIGKLYIPAGAIDHTSTTYVRNTSPTLGGNFAFKKITDRDIESVNPTGYFNNFNRQVVSGIFHLQGAPNSPRATTHWSLLVSRHGDWISQLAIEIASARMYTRVSANGGTSWTAWSNTTNSDVVIDFAPIQALIGTRLYDEENYILDGESITSSLNKLDMALNDFETDLSALELDVTNLESRVGANVYPTGDAGAVLTEAPSSLTDALNQINLYLRRRLSVSKNLGAWNMTAISSAYINYRTGVFLPPHGKLPSLTNLVGVDIMIEEDDTTDRHPIYATNGPGNTIPGGYYRVAETPLVLIFVNDGGRYNTALYNGTSKNRGVMTVTYDGSVD